MEFIETKNKDLEVNEIAMSCDGCLGEDLIEPLNSFRSGFNLLIAGYSGSGKTTLLINLLSKPKKKKIRQSFKGLFHNIFIVSPSLHTLGKNIFDDLDSKKKFKKLDNEMLDNFEEYLQIMKEEEELKAQDEERDIEPKYTLLVLDDVATSLRKDKKLEQRFINLLQNRRHLGLGGVSVITIVQSIVQVAPQHRNNLSHLISFKPKNTSEMERIYKEFLPYNNKYMNVFFEFFFKDKHDFLLVDLTLRNSADFQFYRKYNKVDFKITE